MGLDTKHRPLTYKDVLGQEGTIEILKYRVAQGKGRHSSYRFAGLPGGGKTTLARIFARALLCESPREGEPCDTCGSCRAMLEGTSLDFVEVDAATKSGKADVKRIVESLEYLTLSGRQVIYLFDEAHQLSKDAFAALLKSMEDSIPGSMDKKLVCLFCTTAPEKMEPAVVSRCGPTFLIHPVPVDYIVERLQTICWVERIKASKEALRLIVEISECGIRESINSLEGIAVLGEVTVERVSKYLHLDANALCLEVLACMGEEAEVLLKVQELLKRVSPASAYEMLARTALLAYESHLGATTPGSYWNKEALSDLAQTRGSDLLAYAHTFSSRPGKPTPSMLVCDVLVLSRYGVLPVGSGSLSLPFPVAGKEAPPESKPKRVLPEKPKPGTPNKVNKKGLTGNGIFLGMEAQKDVGGAPVPPPIPATENKLEEKKKLQEALLKVYDEGKKDGIKQGREEMERERQESEQVGRDV